MDAGALGCGQVINAPPAHLQEYERNEQDPQGETRPVSGYLPVMHIDEIGEPGDSGPCLLRIPRPVVTPCLLGPEGTKEHADGHKGEADVNKIV